MAGNHVLLETISLTQSAASVTFSNIPQSGYTDLKVVASARGTTSATGENLYISLNGSSSSFTFRYLQGNGSSAYSATSSLNYIGTIPAATSTSNTFGNFEMYIPNYTGSTYKSISTDGVEENNATSSAATLVATLWSNTAAINQVTLAPASGSFVQYSTFSLYGVAAVGTEPVTAPLATGGNIVANDGTYWYHAFLTSGNFVPQTALTCDYLVVAGGGGGGKDNPNGVAGSGGGAGGLRSTVTATGGGGSVESAISVTSGTSYTVTIGAGGATGTGAGTIGTAGGNSTFSTVTSIGGGGGGSYATSGGNGGSGGGGSYGIAGGSGTANQGYAGGTVVTNNSNGAGGGGAGGIGGTANATGPTKGTGGAGVTITALATPTSTGVSGAYAGGGGGGRYGTESAGPGTASAGGGAGGDASNGTSGTSNTGGGGGGGASNSGAAYNGGAGGSGVVIIRYAMV